MKELIVTPLQAGLFSAAVTAFLIDSYKLLQPDSGDEMKDLLKQILAVQMAGASLNTSILLPPTGVTPPFKPSPSAIAVNVLWFLSLSCALATALSVTLVQRWIRDYLQRIERTSQPQRRATIRGIMFLGSEKWEMSKAVEYIPTLLHLSLFSFFTGLCVFLWNINKVTAGVVLGIVVICLFCYGMATVAPLFDNSAPYETPFSYLLWRAQQIIIGSADRPINQEEIQEQLQAISYVYGRATDDHELQELVGSIPGLLHSRDGQYAWQMFLSRSGRSYQELESRTVRLLKGCTPAGYLDPNSRQLRATLCLNALLAFSSFDSFKQNHLSNSFEFDEFILAPWDDDGTLATKAACTEALFRRRSLIFEISRIQSYSSDFHDLANRADQALRDIDDLREILEHLLKEPETALKCHELDIAVLLDVYLAVMKPMVSDVESCAKKTQDILPTKLRLLSWYSSLNHSSFRAAYDDILEEPMHVGTLPCHILGFLRLHQAYPIIPDTTFIPLDTSLSQPFWRNHFAIHLPLSWEYCSGPNIFKLPYNEGVTISGNRHTQDVEPFDTKRELSASIHRELAPLFSLLSILEDHRLGDVISFSVVSTEEKSQKCSACHLMSLISRSHGPFHLLEIILTAIVTDEDMISGLLMLISTLKFYKPIKPFKPSVIDQWLETICPCLSTYQWSPQSTGSQVLLVLALLEIFFGSVSGPPSILSHSQMSPFDISLIGCATFVTRYQWSWRNARLGLHPTATTRLEPEHRQFIPMLTISE